MNIDPQAELPPAFDSLDTLLIAVRREHPEATKKDVVFAMLDMMTAPFEASGLAQTLRSIAEDNRGSTR